MKCGMHFVILISAVIFAGLGQSVQSVVFKSGNDKLTANPAVANANGQLEKKSNANQPVGAGSPGTNAAGKPESITRRSNQMSPKIEADDGNGSLDNSYQLGIVKLAGPTETTVRPMTSVFTPEIVNNVFHFTNTSPSTTTTTLGIGHNTYIYPLKFINAAFINKLKNKAPADIPNCRPGHNRIQQYWVMKKSLLIPMEVLVTCNDTIRRDAYNDVLLKFIRGISSVRRADSDTDEHTTLTVREMHSAYSNRSVYEYALTVTGNGTRILATSGNNIHLLSTFYEEVVKVFPIDTNALYYPQCELNKKGGGFVELVDACAMMQRITYLPNSYKLLPDSNGASAGTQIRLFHVHCCCQTRNMCARLMPQRRNQVMCAAIHRSLSVLHASETVYEHAENATFMQSVKKLQNKRCYLIITIMRKYVGTSLLNTKIIINNAQIKQCAWESYLGDTETCDTMYFQNPYDITNRTICCMIKCDVERDKPEDVLTEVTNRYMMLDPSKQPVNVNWKPSVKFSNELFNCIYFYSITEDSSWCYLLMKRTINDNYTTIPMPSGTGRDIYVTIRGYLYPLQKIFSDGAITQDDSRLASCIVVGLFKCRFDKDGVPNSQRTLRRCIARQQQPTYNKIVLLCWCRFDGNENKICDRTIPEDVNSRKIKINRTHCLQGRSDSNLAVAVSETDVFCYEKRLYASTPNSGNGTVKVYGFLEAMELHERLGDSINCLPARRGKTNIDVDKQCATDHDGFICCCMSNDLNTACNKGDNVDEFMKQQHFLELDGMPTTYRAGSECEYSYTLNVGDFGYGATLQPLCLFIISLGGKTPDFVALDDSKGAISDGDVIESAYQKFRLVELRRLPLNIPELRSQIQAWQICEPSNWSASEHIRGCACRAFFVGLPEARIACCCSSDLARETATDMLQHAKVIVGPDAVNVL